MFSSDDRKFLLLLFVIFSANNRFVDSFESHRTSGTVFTNSIFANDNRTTEDFINFTLKMNKLPHLGFTNIQKGKVEVLSNLLKIHVDKLRDKTDQVELVFLVDASASVGLKNFQSELNFVRKLLSDFTVAPAATRVAVVTFAGKRSIIRHVDQISSAEENNHKCRLLNQQLGNISYTGGGTYTRGALLEALDILERSRSRARKAVFLITDGFSNGGDPRPAATLLKQRGVVVFTFGIRTGNIEELHYIASEPGYTHSYLLDSFPEFEALARRALHHDLKAGDYVPVNSLRDCDLLCTATSAEDTESQCCDTNAICACGIATGHYACICNLGYYGSGFYGSCKPCPNGTFSLGNIHGDSRAACTPCPDVNHITLNSPATSLTDCICAAGFITNGNKCEAITCPRLRAPANGYLVKANACNNVVNAACGVRCKIGFHLTGDSIRLCRRTGSWSGTEPQCLLKTCPALQAPPHGNIRCEHEDERQVISTNQSAYPIDTHCEYKCDLGYQLRGSRARNCLPLSRWDGLKVTCRPIKCQPLKSVSNGEIIPESCTSFNKVSFGTNCTIRCKPGFIRKGPQNKVCSGRTGSWTQRHSVTRCIDNTPPTITCPPNMTLTTLPGKNYAVVNWSEPVALDNSEILPTVWGEPFVAALSEIKIGVHLIKYVAQDASKNKAECYFRVDVVDKEPPTIENCVDPPTFLLESNSATTRIAWDEPEIYDNSGLSVEIARTHVPGKEDFKVGKTEVIYNVTDKFNNNRICVLNITVEDACENLPSPINGYSNCDALQDGVRCVVTCAEGYGFVLGEQDSHLNDDNITLTCNQDHHSWNNDAFPDCSVTQVPYAVAQDLTVSFHANNSDCEDPVALNKLGSKIKASLESGLLDWCENELECSLTQSSLICEDEYDEKSDSGVEQLNQRVKRRVALNSNRMAKRRDTGNTFSNSSVKTERSKKRNRSKNGKRSGQKWERIEVTYKIIGKILENNNNNSKHGIARLREKFERMIRDGQLNMSDSKTIQEIGRLALNLDFIFKEPKELCHSGSVLKKQNCVKCPLGTFHNATRNQCQSCPFGEYQDQFGSSDCKKCAEHKSTRKMHSKNETDCLNICRPGYYSRRKRHHKSTLALEPCVTCAIGFYQPSYAQSKCLSCPQNKTTVTRGAKQVDECISVNDDNPCNENPCLNGGQCVNVDNDFSCVCKANFIGSLCEILPNPCDSSPCLNDAQCLAANSSNDSLKPKCVCKSGYTGVNCETHIDECLTSPCQNNGVCVSTEEDFECICQDGFEGEVCEIELNHCALSPCESGSTCRSVNATWECTCKPGFLGRRCSRLPCDWLPCHANSICVNIEEINATKQSYSCECAEGYTGENCTTPINHCENSPCMNNGSCVNNLSNYTCDCRRGFNGSNCEFELSSAYILNFPKSGTTDYIMIDGASKNISQFTVCLWLQSVDTFNYGTVLSYATNLYDNALTLTDYNGFVIYINGERVVTDITANDGYWHFVCINWENLSGSWKVFVDGIVKDNGTSFATGMEIEGNGTLVIGQEQDLIGGGFSESESLLGRISLMDIWDEVLDDDVIKNLTTWCKPYQGSLYSWAQLQVYIQGNVEIEESTFCKACSLPVAPMRGAIELNDDASEVTYTCDKGYVVKFGKIESVTLKRRCLKQGQWEGYHSPICTRIKCGFPGYFPRGQLHGRSYNFGDRIRYSCKEGSRLRGNPNRICTAEGTWSGVQPLCIGTTCKNLLAPDNGDIAYLIEEHERDDTSILQVGQQLEFKCNPGFRLLGDQLLTCMENGEWDNPVPRCIAFGCPPPEALANGYIASNLSTEVEILPEVSSSSETVTLASNESAETGYLYGDIVGFACNEGYKFLGNHNMIAEFRIQCTSNGSWNGVVPTCVMLHCLRPELIKNAKSYLLSGNITTTEIPRSEKFSNLTFVNKLIPISEQPAPNFDGPFDIPLSTEEVNDSNWAISNLKQENSPMEEFQAEFNSSFILGAQISIICNKGYKLVGESVRKCTKNETWSSEVPHCERQECKFEENPLMEILIRNKDKIKWDNGVSVTLMKGEITRSSQKKSRLGGKLENFAFASNGSVYGDTMSLTCLNGTRIDFKDTEINKVLNNITWICNEYGKWENVDNKLSDKTLQLLMAEKEAALCEKSTCELPKVPTNAYLVNFITNNTSKKAGDLITYKCRPGYFLEGSEDVKCLTNGTWSTTPYCKPIVCGDPPSPPNTVLDNTSSESTAHVSGNMVSYLCVSGYKMYGRGTARCLADGTWSKMSGRCARISCGKPAVPSGVRIEGPSYLYRDYLTYVCPDEMKRGKIICNSDGKWSKFPDCTK